MLEKALHHHQAAHTTSPIPRSLGGITHSDITPEDELYLARIDLDAVSNFFHAETTARVEGYPVRWDSFCEHMDEEMMRFAPLARRTGDFGYRHQGVLAAMASWPGFDGAERVLTALIEWWGWYGAKSHGLTLYIESPYFNLDTTGQSNYINEQCFS